MFSYNDSIGILSEKIVPALSSMVAREGLQVSKIDMGNTKIVEKLAQLCCNNKEFTLTITSSTGDFEPLCMIERWGDNSTFERIRINFAEGINDYDNCSQIIKYHSDNYFNIPTTLPSFLHKFVLAVMAEWL